MSPDLKVERHTNTGSNFRQPSSWFFFMWNMQEQWILASCSLLGAEEMAPTRDLCSECARWYGLTSAKRSDSQTRWVYFRSFIWVWKPEGHLKRSLKGNDEASVCHIQSRPDGDASPWRTDMTSKVQIHKFFFFFSTLFIFVGCYLLSTETHTLISVLCIFVTSSRLNLNQNRLLNNTRKL